MATELVPVVDLRVLSQSDLDALAAASVHAVAPRSCPDADPLPPLKIDRAVFNESAGSRKQTFSRLRLAAASSPSALPTSTSSTPLSARDDPENHLIAYHLRCLFTRDDPSLPPSSSPPPPPETLTLPAPSPSQPRSASPDPDRETTNSKGVSVDLVRLAGMVDPYGGELRRRTAGLMSESELMGFINGLAGQWVSQGRRRKFVDAAFFGDHLPIGWKLQLGLKREERIAWVHCHSYVSPKGNQFATCKEVSAYLMSLLGYPEAKTVTIQYDGTGQHDDGDDDAVGFHCQIGSSVDNQNVLRVTSVTFPSHSSDSKDKDERNIDAANAYECQRCNLTFHDQSAYEQHQLLFHRMRTKRRKTGKFGEPVVGKDGKFECPVCHKTFEEQSRYFGHVGAHARYQGMTPESFLDKTSTGKVVNYSLADLSFSLQELTGSPEQMDTISAGEAVSQHHNYSNKHGGNSSKVVELFSTNCSDNFNRPNEAWRRPEEIPPITDAPSACKYTNNIMDCADVTVSKVASQSNDQLDGRINGFAEVTGFNDQAGSHHVFRPTTFGTANHYEDQIIVRGMAASKHGEVNHTVKARDVNLNSRLDTISFPIASANNETSTALNEANRSSITGKCFSGSFNNNDGVSTASSCSGSINKISSSLGVANRSSNAARCFSASYGNDNGAGKVNNFGNRNNTMVYHSSLSMCPVSPVATNVDCFASHPMHSKNSDKEREYNTKEQMQNRTSNEARFGAGAYNNNVFTGDITERSLAQFNNNFNHIKPNISSSCSLSESNTLTASNSTKGSNVNCMKGSFVNRSDANCMKSSFVSRPISNNEPHGSVLEVMGKTSNDMQNRYNECAPGCDPLASASASQNVNGIMSMQANFDSMSSLVCSVDVPMRSTTQDQCDLQLGFGGQKQHIFPGYGELRPSAAGSPQLGSMVRNNSLLTGSSQYGNTANLNSLPTGSSQFRSLARPNFVQTGSSQFGSMARPNSVPPAESSQFGSMATQNFVSAPEPTLVLGYAPQMGSGPPAQLGWDLSLSRMVTGGMLTGVCVWCNIQFHHFGTIDEQQAGSFGFICPACKDKISGQRNMPNNGSWQP